MPKTGRMHSSWSPDCWTSSGGGRKTAREKTRTALLTHFKSLKRLREASEEEVAAVVGPAKAKTICAALKNNDGK